MSRQWQRRHHAKRNHNGTTGLREMTEGETMRRRQSKGKKGPRDTTTMMTTGLLRQR
ncbi:hypothetical protein L208DRAFT_1384646 [Tricholoma matsutake]|nr:hypothetical protein L208DRAFT_1384646 [Tricholoma matsutake 945]